ncbi:hypothetical protein DFS33DRAFT_1378950 [Desarmillaria ectypa]|nr:hypothetical protein DFS33DRAFT_1378950 [Desarmillaria ectypa]
MSSNPTVQSIVVQAIGGLDPALQSKAEGLFGSQMTIETPLPGAETKLEQLLPCKLVVSGDLSIPIDLAQTPGVEFHPVLQLR